MVCVGSIRINKIGLHSVYRKNATAVVRVTQVEEGASNNGCSGNSVMSIHEWVQLYTDYRYASNIVLFKNIMYRIVRIMLCTVSTSIIYTYRCFPRSWKASQERERERQVYLQIDELDSNTYSTYFKAQKLYNSSLKL